jgi:DNA-directed RNA polymerase alpha subunit
MSDLLLIPIAEFKFSRRLHNCLTANGIATLGDLIECTEIDLLKMPGLGKVCFAEAKAALDERGLKFVPWRVRWLREQDKAGYQAKAQAKAGNAFYNWIGQ